MSENLNGEAGRMPRTTRSAQSTGLGGASSSEVPPTVSSSRSSRPARRGGVPRARRMNLSITHVQVWSVAKVAFMLSIAGAIIQIVAAALVWVLLDAVGVFGQLTNLMSSVNLDSSAFNLSNVLSLSTVLSAVTILSIIGVVLVTLLAVIGALLYNVVSSLVGGLHVTLGDD
ncbi:DUF3566 domain-containing protein [Bifidobacterium jacchi]|uniref:DUF3566 domain-containing protein n=1 Tax=Bifidobacterium jacchi TaxID=2490545 RepID=A0A5N5RP86_9BIFI|nr:DUF3566 domain-containing protein [Bifidobacterium jacchi]KAB5608551.1 DUF3566 domain-containing protein [Bifidobacterium jacchi]